MSREEISKLTFETLNDAVDTMDITDSEKTKLKLKLNKRISPYPFDTYGEDTVNKDCILIMGINPAGDEKDAEREKRTGENEGFYFCRVDTDFFGSDVFKSDIFELAKFKSKKKGKWYKIPEDELIKFIEKNNLTCYEDYIMDEYRVKNLFDGKEFKKIKDLAKKEGYKKWYDLEWDVLETEIVKSSLQNDKEYIKDEYRSKKLSKENGFFKKMKALAEKEKHKNWYDLEWSVLETEIENYSLFHLKKLIKEEYEIKRSDKFFNNSYFSPLLNLATDTLGGCKWPWCNMPEEKITTAIDKEPSLRRYKKLIMGFRKYSINYPTMYTGDMFYYHETDQKELEKILAKIDDDELQKHCEKMLSLHIKLLKEQKVNVKYVYINNAKVSGWLTKDNNKDTYEIIEGVPVFYGSMVSGGHMDSYSFRRLVNDIKAYLDDPKNK